MSTILAGEECGLWCEWCDDGTDAVAVVRTGGLSEDVCADCLASLSED